MFRFTQKPSSENSPVLRWNYQYGLSVLVGIDVVSVMAAYQPVVQACGTLTNEHWKKCNKLLNISKTVLSPPPLFNLAPVRISFLCQRLATLFISTNIIGAFNTVGV